MFSHDFWKYSDVLFLYSLVVSLYVTEHFHSDHVDDNIDLFIDSWMETTFDRTTNVRMAKVCTLFIQKVTEFM
jgi:hypothetical protein